MPSYQLTLKQRLDLERELDRRAVEAGLVAPTIKPQPPKPTAAQASVAARKERTLASLGPKVARAIRHQKRDAEWEKERSELQAKREQLESQVSPVPTQRTARKRVAWADSEKRVHTFVGYKKLLRKYSFGLPSKQCLTSGFKGKSTGATKSMRSTSRLDMKSTKPVVGDLRARTEA
ncbi:MAG: hypothetical protein Q9204_005073 [Flavoplaca sp. TL-2023a]